MKHYYFLIVGLFVWIAPALLQAQGVERYRTFHLEGKQKVAKNDYKGAIDSYSQAIKIMPYYPAIFLDRGDAKLVLEDYQGAIEDF